MARGKDSLRRRPQGYLERTHRPLNCLVFVLPLLAAYELGAAFLGHRLLAVKHLYELLEVFGATGRLLPPLLVVAVLLIWHVLTRQGWRVDWRVLPGMLAESALLMVPLLLLMIVTDRALTAPAQAAGTGSHAALAGEKLLRSAGAGVYEEFLFRLAAIGLFLLLTVDVVSGPRKPMVSAAVILTSVLFSLYHFVGGTFDGYRFVFRALAGAYLAGLYITRGFGIAVGTHACYNVFVAVI